MRGRDRGRVALPALLLAVALIMIAAPVVVLLGEKVIVVSPSLWNRAVDLCRVVTGMFGLLMIVSVMIGRGLDSGRHDTLGSILSGVVFIAAAVAGLGLVIVVTGLFGLGFLYAGGAMTVDAFRSRHREPTRPELAPHA